MHSFVPTGTGKLNVLFPSPKGLGYFLPSLSGLGSPALKGKDFIFRPCWD